MDKEKQEGEITIPFHGKMRQSKSQIRINLLPLYTYNVDIHIMVNTTYYFNS